MAKKLVAAEGRSLDTDGIDIEYFAANGASFRCKITRAGGTNDKFNKAFEKALRPYRRSGMDLSQVPPAKQREIMQRLYSETIIVDWNQDDFGEPFSTEAAYETMKQVPSWLDFLVSQANQASLFRVVNLETEAGNS